MTPSPMEVKISVNSFPHRTFKFGKTNDPIEMLTEFNNWRSSNETFRCSESFGTIIWMTASMPCSGISISLKLSETKTRLDVANLPNWTDFEFPHRNRFASIVEQFRHSFCSIGHSDESETTFPVDIIVSFWNIFSVASWERRWALSTFRRPTCIRLAASISESGGTIWIKIIFHFCPLIFKRENFLFTRKIIKDLGRREQRIRFQNFLGGFAK